MTKRRIICSVAFFVFPIHVLASAPSSDRFTISSSGDEITDNRTHLIWQARVENKAMTWSSSLTYCSNRGKGWRLPSIEELETLVDFSNYEPALDTTVFASPPSIKFWTSTTSAEDDNNAWMVDFDVGESYIEDKKDMNDKGDKEDPYLVRCVKKE